MRGGIFEISCIVGMKIRVPNNAAPQLIYSWKALHIPKTFYFIFNRQN